MGARERAERAQSIIDDEIFQDAFNFVRSQYFDAASKCGTTDDIGRFRLLEAARMVDAVRDHLAACVRTGSFDRAGDFEGRQRFVRKF